MKEDLSVFVVGLLFALGLGLSGMTQPAKVIAFLDFFGHWDPSLMLVMIGAIGVHAVAYRLIIRREQPVLSDKWHIPERKDITVRLIIGAAIFGIGWGLAGYCPGPALVSLASLQPTSFIFVAFLLLGMSLYRAFQFFFD